MISTNNIKPSDSKQDGPVFISKEIRPGNVLAKVDEILFVKRTFIKDREEWDIKIKIETPPIGEGFVGFDVEFGNPAKGKRLGQTATIRLNSFPLYTGVSASGKAFSLETGVNGILGDFCSRLGIREWLSSGGGKVFPNYEALFAQLNADKPFKNIYVHFCLTGRQYINKKNYLAYDIGVAKSELGKLGYALDREAVVDYDITKHLTVVKSSVPPATTAEPIKPTSSEVSGFGSVTPEAKPSNLVFDIPLVNEKKVPNNLDISSLDLSPKKPLGMTPNTDFLNSDPIFQGAPDDLPF